MDSKNRLQNLFRGWLPKDQFFQNGAYKTPKNSVTQDRPMTKRSIRALRRLGVANLIILICYSSYYVIYMLTPSIWTSGIGFGIWAAIILSMVFFNYMLYGNFKKQAKLPEDA